MGARASIRLTVLLVSFCSELFSPKIVTFLDEKNIDILFVIV